jgi:hypothetical protein
MDRLRKGTDIMKNALIVIPLLALALSGCGGRTMVKESKETIIEKQAPTTESRREIVVQSPPVTREIVIQAPTLPAPQSCLYSSASFAAYTLSCQSGQQMRCEDGSWVRKGAC